jgi:hypothetical protein
MGASCLLGLSEEHDFATNKTVLIIFAAVITSDPTITTATTFNLVGCDAVPSGSRVSTLREPPPPAFSMFILKLEAAGFSETLVTVSGLHSVTCQMTMLFMFSR